MDDLQYLPKRTFQACLFNFQWLFRKQLTKAGFYRVSQNQAEKLKSHKRRAKVDRLNGQ